MLCRFIRPPWAGTWWWLCASYNHYPGSGDLSLWQELYLFRSLLANSTDLQVQQRSYNTTFNLGYFYMSYYSHMQFIESPVVPPAFLIHERKLDAHVCAQRSILQWTSWQRTMKLPCVHDKDIILADDAEPDVTSSLTAAVTSMQMNNTWTHHGDETAATDSDGDSMCATCRLTEQPTRVCRRRKNKRDLVWAAQSLVPYSNLSTAEVT